MKILLLGSTGLVGSELKKICKFRGINIIGFSHDQIEITDYESPRARKKELTLTKKEGKVDRGEGSIPFNLNSDDDFPALSL